MLLRIFLCCLPFFIEGVSSQTTQSIYTEYFCNNLKNDDCNNHNVSERCGTDNITYRNGCELAKAYCIKDIHQAHMGKCTSDPNVTRSPDEVKHGSELAYEIECVRLMHINCGPQDPNEVCCGSDGYTYDNFCEFSKGKCTHRDLHIRSLGACTV
ncbi:agrin-like [Ruditapes philippinarum]|uniref:agrin-like n=1 Tax=Ruditapes philippinarum TaxID=129788 RepID=UPI00295C043A|nr:agrin-like [Ruditapes philippinarum]